MNGHARSDDSHLLSALHDALVVAQTSSVGEAARRLHKTPSAVSQQLRRIEQHYGVELFERVGRGVRLSPAGEAAFGALTRVFDEAGMLSTLLQELAGARIATLRVAASDYLGEALLVPAIRWLFHERVPLRFDITTTHSSEARRLVEQGQADVAIVVTDREATGDEVPLFRQSFAWVAPRARGRRGGSVLARLAHEPILRLAPGSHGRRLLDECLGRQGIRPVSTIDLPSVSLMLSYVSRGLGIGLVPSLALERLNRTRVVIEPADVPDAEVRLLLRAAFKRTAPVKKFLERLQLEASRVGRPRSRR